MIFLKKFKANGFKSFADNVEINFDKPMVGIVGPNGSGKSNIVDAFKWVLGERSLKQLRGKSSEDIIFFGSSDKKPSMFAEVSLYFDNSTGALHSAEKELVITRKIHRGSGISEYFINGQDATLKDITNIFLDTGLAKGSLGIISQGTISWFVEAKPEERRTIFEEAAGIGRYSKKKSESLNDLERTDKNIHDVDVVMNALSRDLKNLEKQAAKAKNFLEKKEKLKNIELTVLVKDYLVINEEITKIQAVLNDSTTDVQKLEPEIAKLSSVLKIAKEKYNEADKVITDVQARLQVVYEESNQCEQRRMLIEQELKNSISSDDKKSKAKAIGQLIKAHNFELNEHIKNIENLTKAIETDKQKIEKDAQEIKEGNESINAGNSRLNYLKEYIRFLREYQENDLAKERGVQAVLKNINSLTGINGIVQNLIKVPVEYEKAMAIALGKATKFFVATDTNSALRAIDFLKQNKAGRATFLPLEKVKERMIKADHLDVINAIPGFVGVGVNLVKCDRVYLPIIRHLLGNIIISQDLESAVKISNYTFQNYRVISLDGQVVHVAGAISGGSESKTVSVFNIDNNIANSQAEFDKLTEKMLQVKIQLEKKQSDYEVLNNSLQSKILSLQKHQSFSDEVKDKISNLSIEYENLTNETYDGQKVVWNQDKVQKKSIRLAQEKEDLLEKLRSNQQIKDTFSKQITDGEKQMNELWDLVNKQKNLLVENKSGFVEKNAKLEAIRNRIGNVYRLTIENAVEEYNKELPCSEKEARNMIMRLQSEIDSLGSINIESIDDVETVKNRYDTLVKQRDDLQNARNQLQDVVDELDNRARADFQSLIDRLNEMLPQVFKYLFGGGTCQIRYNDPNADVLVTGIDVFANPLGKHISNLNLLSGGEKTLVALSVLFSILRISAFPLVILDEAESALDPANVERFANIIRSSTDNTQFIVITHRQGTMVRCDKLLGATMQVKGVTKMFSVSLENAKEYVSVELDKE